MTPVGNSRYRLREDFARGLADQLQPKLGQPGSETRKIMEKAFSPILTDGKIDIEKLPEAAQKELHKLQGASEQFESFFVKKLLSQMRQTSLSQNSTPMMDFAKDTMDQAVADQAAKGQSTLGIAKTVFMAQAATVVQQEMGKRAAEAASTPSGNKS